MNKAIVLAVLLLLPGIAGAVNVKNYKQAGETDYTNAINRAIEVIRNQGGGVLKFPRGTFRTKGDHDVTGINGFVVKGKGVEVTKIDIIDQHNDLFHFRHNARHHTYEDFTVVSSEVERRGGWVLRTYSKWDDIMGGFRRTRIRNIEIRQQQNGLWIGKYEFAWIDNVQMLDFTAGGVGLHIGMRTFDDRNMGSELFVRNTAIFGIQRDPWQVENSAGPEFGIIIEDTDAAYLTNTSVGAVRKSALLIRSNQSGHAPHNHFFTASFFDATHDGPSVWLKGKFMTNITFDGCWFASAGRLSEDPSPHPAFLVDVKNMGMLQINGGRVLNATGDGIKMTSVQSLPVMIEGTQIHQNDGLSINVAHGPNTLGPLVDGVSAFSFISDSDWMRIDSSRIIKLEDHQGEGSSLFHRGDVGP